VKTKAKAPRRATKTAPRRREPAESTPIATKDGKTIDLRSPWPFPVSIGTENKKGR